MSQLLSFFIRKESEIEKLVIMRLSFNISQIERFSNATFNQARENSKWANGRFAVSLIINTGGKLSDGQIRPNYAEGGEAPRRA